MGVMGITVEAVGVVVPLGRGHLGEAELVLEHLHVLEQRLVGVRGGARWLHGTIGAVHGGCMVGAWWVHGACMVPVCRW